MKSPRLRSCGFLAILGGLILAGGGCLPSSDFKAGVSVGPEALLGTLVQCRPFAGRLSGQEYYVPFRSHCKVAIPRVLLSKINTQQRGTINTPQSLAERGVLNLLVGNYDKSIELLGRAHASAPDDLRIANDLGVAYLARADKRNFQYDLIFALGVVEQVRENKALFFEAEYNYALILGQLYLHADAATAWRAYLRHEIDSEWRKEATRTLNILKQNDRTGAWQRAKEDLKKAAAQGDRNQIFLLTAKFPQEARIWVQQDVLSSWAHDHLLKNYSSAEVTLRLAREVGAALAKINGERTIAASISAIDRAKGELLNRIALGHLCYATGMGLHGALQIEDATKQFRHAEYEFERAASPAALWCRYWLATADYYKGRNEKALKELRQLLGLAISDYPALEGRIRWSLGLIEMMRMDLGNSLGEYGHAIRIFKSLGELENLGSVEYLTAENYQLLGEVEQAWQYREEALGKLSVDRASVSLNNLLLEASKALLQQGRFVEALRFQEEEFRVARRLARPATLAESLLLRQQLLAFVGMKGEAVKVIENAKRYVGLVADEAIRKRLVAELIIAQCQLLGPESSRALLEPLGKAIDFFKKNGLQHNAVRGYVLRSRIYSACGEGALAERDLAQGIESYRRARERLGGRQEYYTYLDQWQLLFDDAILLRVRQGRFGDAWSLLEQSKGAKGPGGDGYKLNLDYIKAHMPSKTILVEYAVLPDRLLVWEVRQNRWDIFSYPMGELYLRMEVEKFIRVTKVDPMGRDWVDVSGRLFDELVRPVLSHSASDEKLVFVPDKFLGNLSFSALWDSQLRAFLLERRVLAFSPSADLYAHAALHSSRWHIDRANLLSVASNQARATSSGENLPSLPSARKEAEEVAQLYPRKDLLLGTGFSRESLLDDLKVHDVFHFAGHAYTNPENPALSRLVLGEAEPSKDLFGIDILKQNLGKLSLVVLSACQSGAGGERRGGAEGMAWAFQEAGVPAVVATLWSVDDGISRSLSVSFHEHLLAGMEGAEALRKAQLSWIRSPTSRTRPLEWAAFEFFGELRAVR